MKRRSVMSVFIGIILIAFMSFIILLGDNNKFNSCTIVTDSRFTTLLNDGGSNYNIYYEIDLNNYVVKKYEDYYIGFRGYEYQNKLIYNKNIKSKKIKDLGNLLEDLISKEDINTTDNYNPFLIKCDGSEKDIYNYDSIKLLKDKLLEFDEY